MTDEEYVKSQRALAIATAQDMIAGKIGIIAGSRILSGLRFEVDVSEDDQDFLTFVGIDSETDHLPVGQAREYWSPEALREKDVEVKRSEDFYGQYAKEACKNIIKRWKGLV